MNITKTPSGNYAVEAVCPFCGKISRAELTEAEFNVYSVHGVNGLAFLCKPPVPADVRELLVTGGCAECTSFG